MKISFNCLVEKIKFIAILYKLQIYFNMLKTKKVSASCMIKSVLAR